MRAGIIFCWEFITPKLRLHSTPIPGILYGIANHCCYLWITFDVSFTDSMCRVLIAMPQQVTPGFETDYVTINAVSLTNGIYSYTICCPCNVLRNGENFLIKYWQNPCRLSRPNAVLSVINQRHTCDFQAGHMMTERQYVLSPFY